MMCKECNKRPATLHFTKIINGEKTELVVCEVCAREKGELISGTANGFSIHNLLSGLLDLDSSPTAALGVKPAPQPRCDCCGLTYSQFSKLGRFGCSSCYRHFSDRLDPLLKRVHGNSIHIGKVPRRTGGLIKDKREIEQLKLDLQQAIHHEEFERAAKIRDHIRNLEKKITGT